MKIDGALPGHDLRSVGSVAKELEDLGYTAAFSAETSHDPFFPLLLAAEHTERLELGTGIAVAFPRSPMHLANIGWDLQAYSKGRFLLGLGSQIRAHVEKRFSATWSNPAARLRDPMGRGWGARAGGPPEWTASPPSRPATNPWPGNRGGGGPQPGLHRLSKQGEWVEMGTLISDEIVSTFAVIGEPEEIPKLIL